MKIKVCLVLNKTMNYIQHMVLPVPYRLFLTVGKEENAGNQHFLLLPQCFLFCETQL